jgi:MAP3K TRAFs-binding domain
MEIVVDETVELAPLCFVLMPFGKKMDAAGRVTNFDSIYTKIIAPAVARAGLEPIRADEEKIGAWDHATLLELAVLARDIDHADEKLDDALAVIPKPQPWQLKSTAGNLKDIREARESRGEDVARIKRIGDRLIARASGRAGGTT